MQIPTLLQHMVVQIHVGDLAASISNLVRLRLDPVTAPLIENEEGNLLAALASLQFLCSEIRVAQDNTSLPAYDRTQAVVAGAMLDRTSAPSKVEA